MSIACTAAGAALRASLLPQPATPETARKLGIACHYIVKCFDVAASVVTAVRAALLAELTAQPPPETAWEVGGASNFMIAAARLGQRVASVGQLGDDVYGAFFRRVMQVIFESEAPLDPVAGNWTTRWLFVGHLGNGMPH